MILIALGANLPSAAGGPQQTLEAALARLEASGVHIAARSSWYRTAPVPVSDQPWFVNGVVRVETRPRSGQPVGPAAADRAGIRPPALGAQRRANPRSRYRRLRRPDRGHAGADLAASPDAGSRVRFAAAGRHRPRVAPSDPREDGRRTDFRAAAGAEGRADGRRFKLRHHPFKKAAEEKSEKASKP